MDQYIDKGLFSEQIHEEIFNSILDPVFIYHIDKNKEFVKFITVNKTFLDVYGYSEEELKELSLSAISAEKDELAKVVNDIVSDKVNLLQTLHITKSGYIFPVEAHSRFIYLKGQKAIVSIIRDITVRKANEEKLLAINESKDNILKVVSHDLRNPLAQIHGILQILKLENGVETLPHKYLTLIKESLEQAENIVSELLSTEDIESDTTELMFDKLNVNTFCRKLIKHYTIFVKSEKNLSLNCSLPDSGLYILANEKKLTRAFDNIISNAVKFSFPNAKINFKVAVKGNSIQFSIKDYGIGIPCEFKDLIFDKQTVAKRKGTMDEKTIGLGMYITKTIVELHKGRVWFESKEGKGATFFMSLPLIQG